MARAVSLGVHVFTSLKPNYFFTTTVVSPLELFLQFTCPGLSSSCQQRSPGLSEREERGRGTVSERGKDRERGGEEGGKSTSRSNPLHVPEFPPGFSFAVQFTNACDNYPPVSQQNGNNMSCEKSPLTHGSVYFKKKQTSRECDPKLASPKTWCSREKKKALQDLLMCEFLGCRF